MPEFAWRAASRSGALTEGRLAAPDSAAALRQLVAQGLTPLEILDAASVGAASTPAIAALKAPAPRAAKGPVNGADVLALTSELAIMLRAGLALDNALRVLVEMAHKPSVGALVRNVLDAVKGGTPLSRALAAHPAHFGDFYVNMVRSGEASGQMSAVLDRLVEHLQRQRALRDSIVSATIYPAILLTVAVLSLVAMLGFVVPQFEKLFTEMGDALPLPTRIVMNMGHVFRAWGLEIAIAAVVLGALLVRWLRSPAGRAWRQARLLRLPLVGRLALRYQLTLYARSLGTLLANGVPLLTALAIASDAVGNAVLHPLLARIAPIVKEGGKMAQAVGSTGLFEPLAINLIRVGEETGRLGAMMLELSAILEREVENGIKRLLVLLEPLLILILGVLIAAIIVSILLGILSINDLAA